MPPKSESGAPLLAPQSEDTFVVRQPCVLVFLSAGDASNCCAANYERVVFMDKKVVGLTKKLTTLRLDRGAQDPKLLKRYEVKKDKPAIRVLDCEGEVVAGFDTCVNARDVYKAMLDSVKLSKLKVKLAKKVRKMLADADEELKEQDVRHCAQELRRIAKVKGAPVCYLRRAERMLTQLGQEGARRLKEALEREKPTERFDLLMVLRHDFWDFDELVTQIRPAIAKLEEDEKTKELIHDHKGQRQIVEALEMVKKGGAMARKGRGLLRKVRFDWKGYPAAKRAQEELDKLGK